MLNDLQMPSTFELGYTKRHGTDENNENNGSSFFVA